MEAARLPRNVSGEIDVIALLDVGVGELEKSSGGKNVNSKSIFGLLLVLLFHGAMFAQSNELSLSVGAMFSPNTKVAPACEAILVCPATATNTVNLSFAVEGGFAHRLVNAHVASLFVETPFIAAPNSQVSPVGDSEFSRFVFTPSLKVNFIPAGAISPFLSAGAGFSHFGVGSSSDTKGAFQFGGGLDFRTPVPRLSFRVEARDFVTGRPSLAGTGLLGNHLQNVFAGGGIVLKF